MDYGRELSSSGCKGKQKWPELVGKEGSEAVAKIQRENNKVNPRIVRDGMFVTLDFRCDRVWVWVDENGVVVRAPQVG